MPTRGILPLMRTLLLACVLLLAAGCATTTPPAVQDAAAGNLAGWQRVEDALLAYIPADAPPIDFSQIGGDADAPVYYRPRDGWRIILRTYQLRAASLVAYTRNEPFDQSAGLQALVLPAIAQAKHNAPDAPPEEH